ncbi:hypothetical protein [Sulfitobacter noctilucae]|uniref:hypothetical protein n=1 Tax=Sulfitobacter noctilucae TaxID=1342302 RepID=UPI00126816E7|nr:hypothetical protein [Sulfitobacter noctilucae]
MLRSFLSLTLALLLALTSQAMAVTRGASAATGQMVLCIGSGSVTVYTDAEGAPTAAPHICPDCAFGDGLNTRFVPAAVPQTLRPVSHRQAPHAFFLANTPRSAARPRAPPLPV